METIKIIIIILYNIVIVGIIMRVAYYVGERIGFAKFFLYIWQKVKKNKLNKLLVSSVSHRISGINDYAEVESN